MECQRKELKLSSMVVQCSSLVSVLEGCVGPHGKAVLMEQAGSVLITKDGADMLARLEIADPMVNVAVGRVLDYTRKVGDGCKTTFFLLHRLLAALDTHIPHGSGRMEGSRRQRLIQVIQHIRNHVLGPIQRNSIKYGAQVYPVNNFEVFSHILQTSAEHFFITKFSKLIAKNLTRLFSSYISCACSSSKEVVELLSEVSVKVQSAVVEVYHMPLMMSCVVDGFVLTRDFKYFHKGNKVSNVKCVWWAISLNEDQEEEEEEGGHRAIIKTSLREVLVEGTLIKRTQVERTLANLTSHGAELILSTLYFPDWAVCLCAKYGLSLVDSVDEEEYKYLIQRLGVLPIMGETDVCPDALRSLQHIQPLHKGTCKFVQLSGLHVHQIMVCGPTPAQCRQFSSSFLQLFKYLNTWLLDCAEFIKFNNTTQEYDDDETELRDCMDNSLPDFSHIEIEDGVRALALNERDSELSVAVTERTEKHQSAHTSHNTALPETSFGLNQHSIPCTATIPKRSLMNGRIDKQCLSSCTPTPSVVFTIPHGGYGELLAKFLIYENISLDVDNSVSKSVLLEALNELPYLLYRKCVFSRKSYIEFQTRLFQCFKEKISKNEKIVLPESVKEDRFNGYHNPFFVFSLLRCALYIAEHLLRIECIVPSRQRISQLSKTCDSGSDSD